MPARSPFSTHRRAGPRLAPPAARLAVNPACRRAARPHPLRLQICMALIMNPPKPGDPSYDLYARERDGILEVSKSQPSGWGCWSL